jgi:hypothetical protein
MKLVKKLRLLLLTLLSGTLFIALGAHLAANFAEEKVHEILRAIPLKVSSVDANVITRTIELTEVDWTLKNDSLPQFPHHVLVNKIRLEGIKVYQLLANKKLYIRKIVLDGGDVRFNRNLKTSRSQAEEKKAELQGISIDRLVLKDIFTTISADSTSNYEGVVNLTLENVDLANIENLRDPGSYEIKAFKTLITDLKIMGEKDMYETKVAKIYVSSVDNEVEIDSVLLVPKYSRYQFARKVGQQVDRINLLIPKIAIHDLAFTEVKEDSLFKAALVEIKSPKVHVYRDKRVPFKKTTITPLPIAMIRDLKFGMAIDTIKILDANITYEEFPEKGFHTGKVTFERLNASLDHLTNRDHYPDYKQATLNVSSYLMGKGLIKVEFSLPYDKTQVYTAKGSLNNMSLYRMNPALENLAFVSVTSGKLNQLTFDFNYTDRKATGNVLINYENLKINTLTKEEDPEKNEIKTLVVNTLLKKNKDETVDKEKRTGEIDFERDRRRAIFHYWWRSVLTGIKSTAQLPKKSEEEKDKNGKKKKDRK